VVRAARCWSKAALIVAVLLVVFATVKAAAATTGPARSAASPAPTTSAAAPTAAPAPRHASPSARGQITAIDGDSWTISTAEDAAVTVALNGQTAFGTHSAPAVREQFTVGTRVAVTGPLSGNTVRAERVIIAGTHSPGKPPSPTAPTPTAPTPTAPTPPAPTPPAPTPPAPTPTAPTIPPAVNRCAVDTGLNQAAAYASTRDVQAALAVYDTATGTYTSAGDADAEYSTASVVKVLIATELLLTDQMNGDTASTASLMVSASDDDAADALYGLVGGDSVVTTIADHYGTTNLGSPPADTGQWGETKVTAEGLVHLYAKLKADPQVWPWLSTAMAATTRVAADGTDQYFGIAAVARNWAVKQGWMTGLGPGATYASTGYVDGGRYAVAILTYGSADQYGQYMSDTITQMARDLLPGGVLGAPTSSCPT